MGAWDIFDEAMKKVNSPSNETTTSSTGAWSTYNRAMASTYELPKRLEMFVGETKSFFDSFNSRFLDKNGNAINGYVGVSNSDYDSFIKNKEYIESERKALLELIEQNSDKYDSETLSKVKTFLGDENFTSNISSMESMYNYYSSFETEDDYNSYVAYEKKKQEQLSANLAELNAEIKALEDKKDKTREEKDLLAEKKVYLREAQNLQAHKHFTDSALNAGDFEYYAQVGADIKNPTLAEAKGAFSIGKWRPFGEEIGNIVTFSRENWQREYGMADSNGQLATALTNHLYSYMTDEEVKIYNYYLGKGYTDSAQKYLDSLEETLTARHAGQIVENIGDSDVLKVVFGFTAGVDQFATGMKNLFSDQDYYMPTATQMASSELRDSFDTGFGQVVYDLSNTTGNMLPSILIGGVAGTTAMGLSAAGNAKAEMINLGYSKGQAAAYGAMVGASEALLQSVLGGISSLGGSKSLSKAALKAIDSVDNSLARVALKIGTKMGSEALEEATQSVIEPIFKSIVTGGEFEGIDWGEVAYSGLLGALSAGMLEGVGTIATDVGTQKTGQVIQNVGAENRLKEIGSTFSADSLAYKLAGKVNENTDAYTIGRLFKEVGATLTEQNKTDIVNALVEKGMRRSDAQTNAKWLAKVLEGEALTDQQIEIIENDDVLSKVFYDVIVKQNSTANQRIAGYNEAIGMVRANAFKSIAGVDSVLASESTPQGTENSQAGISSTEDETLNRAEILSHFDGKTRLVEDDSEVTVKEIASIQDGVVSLRLDDGRVVDKNDVHFGNKDEGLVYEAVAEMGVGADAANLIIDGFNPKGGISVEDYISGVRSSYNFGYVGMSSNELVISDKTKNLPEQARKAAYNEGKASGIIKNQSAQKAMKETVAKVKEAKKAVKETKTVEKSGRVKLHDIDESTLTKRQSASVKAVERIANVFTNSEFTFFASYVKDGKRVYKDADGNVKPAPSGKFIATDGSIWIDINAGNMGNGLILFTAAHELTHFAKQFSPEQYELFTNFLMEQYGNLTINGKKVSVDLLVERQIEKAKKNGRTITYDEAFDEVVADSCERFLLDGNAIQKLDASEMDKGVVAKIKSFIRNLIKNIKTWYAGLNPDSLEANLISRIDKESYKKLISMWENMLSDAGENYQYIQSDTDFTTNQLSAESDMSINDFNQKETKFQERTEYFVEPKQVFSVSTTNGASDSKMLPKDKWDSVKNIRNKRFAENGFTPKQIAKMNDFIKKTADAMADARIKYRFIGLDDVYNARIILDPRSGEIVLSAMVKNGDYSVNFDFTKICKKRVSLQEVIETLAREKGKTNADGSVTEVNLSSENIFHINEVLASFGIETACLCCFVESKRYNMQSLYQEKVVDVWNRLVTQHYPDAEYYNLADEDVLESKIPEKDWAELERQYNELRTNKKSKADKGEIKDEDESGVEKKMEEFIKANPKEAKLMRFADLVTEKGRTNLNKLYPSVESLVKSKLGTAAPKSVEAFTPYNAEIDLLEAKSGQDLVKYLFSIAGVRSQSFSDFMIAHVFDVLQKTASLSARKMPAHTYTKEIARAMLFGMTGEKHNLSVLFNINDNVDSWNAGLSKEGNYLVADYEAYVQGYSDFVQSIGWKDAVRLQNTEGYSKDCGIIGVGFSYNHMLKMHGDPDVRQIIGYHTSSMPVEVKPLTHLDKAADYTPVQNTLKFSGFAKPNYPIPEGVPSYATPPQDVMKGKKGSKTSKVPDTFNFDIKGTFEKLSKGKTSKARTNAAKQTLRQLLEYANENGLILKTSKAKAGRGDFALYEDVQATKNPYLTADHYIEYCIENGWLPAFYEFALNQNYYKDIFDFNVFDRLSYNPETGLHEDSKERKAYAPQTAVHMLNKDGSLSFPEGFHDIIDHQMNNYDRYRQDVSVKTPAIMQEIRGIKDSKGNPIISTKEQLSDRSVTEISSQEYRNMYDHFGETKNYDVAGYMLKNGVMLDFSGKHWGDDYSTSRQVDHRDISEAYHVKESDNGVGEMVNMISNGNIRLTPETGGINLAVMPNESQFNQLRGYFNHFRGEVIIDIDAVGGDTIHSWEYNRGTSSSKIISDIKKYFENGTIPETQSSLNQFRYSDRVTDKETLNFLENQEHITVYRAMQLIDGKLYPPMNAYTYDEKGKKVLMTASEIGSWEQAVERPDLIDPKTGKFKLDKGKVDGGKRGTVVPAAYNPYIHTSLSMLNDQFTSAYTRSNLVVVKGVVPKSELTSGYKAEYAKDSVGETEWHSGVVSTRLPESRKVILSRWFKPLEIVDNDVVAQNIKKTLGNTGIEIPYNVVSPKLRRSLENIGVPIGEGRGIRNLPSKNEVQYSDRDSYAPTFYSQMGKVIEEMKQEKFGASSVVPMLRGRGVKAEEIRWSGIVTFLEGKKSVTKQELLEFIAGSQLQIGEFTRDDRELSPSTEQEEQIARHEDIAKQKHDVLKKEWEDHYGEEFPYGSNQLYLTSETKSLIQQIKRKPLEEKRDKLKNELDRIIGKNNNLDFKNKYDAWDWLNTGMNLFAGRIETFDNKDILAAADRFAEFCSVNYGGFNDAETQVISQWMQAEILATTATTDLTAEEQYLIDLAKAVDDETQAVSEILSDVHANEWQYQTKWEDYKLDGGENYREIVFTLPNSTYTNRAMRAHWGQDAKGILAHARIQDFVVNGKKMLFIEEIQSDWHNEGHSKGYSTKEYEEAVATHDTLYDKYKKLDLAFHKYVRSNDFMTDPEDVRKKKHDWLRGKVDTAQKKYLEAEKVVNSLKEKGAGDTPDAPYKDTYHEYVLKRLLRMAAEEGYDSIGWTPADIQSKRWSEDYAEGYRIEYDQDMPKFLKKYGRQWGATVEKTTLPNESEIKKLNEKIAELETDLLNLEAIINEGVWGAEKDLVENLLVETKRQLADAKKGLGGTEIWSMELTDSMKNSVLHEGQVLYSLREIVGESGKNYGVGVYLDSQLLSNLSETERIEMVKEYVKELGGKVFTAFDSNHTAVDVHIAKASQKFKNKRGKKVPVNKDLTSYLKEIKQESIALVDELILTSKLKEQKASIYPHGWLDNYGKNPWEYWTTYIQDKENTIWEATLNIATTTNGEKILYDIVPIKKVEQSVTSDTSTTEDSLTHPKANVNEKSENSEKHSDRDSDSLSNRNLLANALESATKNDIEKNKLAQYKQKIDLINSEEQKLHELRVQIKELSFAKGRRDVDKIKSLQFEARQAANRINTYDRQLLNLEASKPLKDVIDREKKLAYKKAEQKGKEALSAYREKSAQTTRELMTRYQESRARAVERRNETELRHKIKKVVGDLNQLLLNPTKDKHVKEELRKAVAEALSVINMDTVGAEDRIAKLEAEIARAKDPVIIDELTASRDRIKHMGENLKDKLTALQTAYEKIKNSEDVEMVNAYQEPVLNTIKSVVEIVGDTPIRYMSLDQLEAVYDMYKMVLHVVRSANKAFKAQKGETITAMAEAVNDQVRTTGGEHYKRSIVGSALRKIGWTFLKPLVAFRTIGSVTLTNLYNNLRLGEDIFYIDIKEAQDFIKNQYEKHNFKSWDMKGTKEFTAKSGKTFKLNLEQMMSLYAYSRREQAMAHILEGGIVFEDSIITEKKAGIPVKYEVTTKSAFNLSEDTLNEIIGSLTAEQKAFVEEMQTYLSDTMGAKGNEVSMEMLGVKLFKEKFYFPLKSSQFYMNFKPEEAGEIKLKNPAFSKETVKHANNPVVLSNFTDVWANHVNDMSMYHSFVLPLEDFTRVFNYKTKTDAKLETMSTEATIANAYGKGATQYIRNFLKSLNGGVRVQGTVADKFISLTKKGAVLASASVTIQQPSAVMRAMAYINPSYFVKATPKSLDLVHHKRAWEELKKYAPVAGIKEMGHFDIGLGQSTVEWIKSQKTLSDKAEDVISKAPAYMDEVTWVSIWNAVKKEVEAKNKDLAVGSEDFLKKCGERFTEVVSLSQVYDSVFSRSDLMRNANPLAKMLTAFMAEPTTTLNMLIDSFIQGKRTGTFGGFLKTTAGTGGAVVAAITFNSMLKSIVMAMRDDDEDETYTEKYFEHLVGDLKDNLNPLTLIPFVKDIVSIFNGYDVERMDMALFSDLKNAIDAFDSESKTEYEKWSGLVGAISAFFGVPIKNVERDIRGFINTISSLSNGEKTTNAGIWDAIKEGWTGEDKNNTQKLYEAIMSGDQAQIDRVKGKFKDEDAIEAAMRQGLRDNDPRIKEAAQARVDGDIAEYTRIAKEIITEGHFKQDTVVSAINAEVNAIKREENEANETANDKDEEPETEEVSSIYSASDINAAFDNGDTATAKEIITDIINTKVANGKTESEAKSAVRSSMTSYWKPLYTKAYKNSDSSEMARIRKILYDSGLYGGANDVVKTCQNWLKDN